MHTFSKFLIGAAGIAALAGAAFAADRDVHILNVMLPDGSVEQVRYTGKVAPRIVVVPQAPRAVPIAFVDPLADIDRVFAEMDARANTMVAQAAAMQAMAPASHDTAAVSALPPGTVSYSYTSYSSGDGRSCSQSVQVTALEPGKAPKVVRQDEGDCSAMNTRQPTPAVAQAAPPRPAPVPASYRPAHPPKADGPTI